MDALAPYSIPIKGLGNGMHEFQFELNQSFFQLFEDSPVEIADLNVKLELDKHSNLMDLRFLIAGNIGTECDRCLAVIHLPVEDEQRLLVKYSETTESNEEADVVYLHPDAPSFSVAQYLYEFSVLAIPLIKAYDCDQVEPRPCDTEMLDRLSESQQPGNDNNPFAEALKKLNN